MTLTFKNVSFRYFPQGPDAISELTCRLDPGIHLLLGENGAGKSTLLRLAAGLLRPCGGAVELDGSDVALRSPATLAATFYLDDAAELPEPSISRFAEVYAPAWPNFTFEAFDANLADFGLTGRERFESLSLGLRRKSLLALAIATRPELLLLDEPANGLDITSKQALRRMLARNVGPQSIVVIATHTVHDLHEMFDSVMVMHGSRLLMSRPIGELSARVAFVWSPLPPADAIYSEPRGGRYLSIVDALEAPESTEIDFTLLYGALMSKARGNVIRLIQR